MWNITRVNGPRPSIEFDLLTIRCFDRCPLKHVECFFAMMNMARDCLTWLIFDDGNNDLHIRARQIASLQLLAVLRAQILSMRQSDESKSSGHDNQRSPDNHSVLPILVRPRWPTFTLFSSGKCVVTIPKMR